MIRRALGIGIACWTLFCAGALVRGCWRAGDAIEQARTPLESRVREHAAGQAARNLILTWALTTGTAAALYAVFRKQR